MFSPISVEMFAGHCMMHLKKFMIALHPITYLVKEFDRCNDVQLQWYIPQEHILHKCSLEQITVIVDGSHFPHLP